MGGLSAHNCSDCSASQCPPLSCRLRTRLAASKHIHQSLRAARGGWQVAAALVSGALGSACQHPRPPPLTAFHSPTHRLARPAGSHESREHSRPERAADAAQQQQAAGVGPGVVAAASRLVPLQSWEAAGHGSSAGGARFGCAPGASLPTASYPFQWHRVPDVPESERHGPEGQRHCGGTAVGGAGAGISPGASACCGQLQASRAALGGPSSVCDLLAASSLFRCDDNV